MSAIAALREWWVTAHRRRPESFYRTRRSDITASVAIGCGLFWALYQGASRWLVLVFGIRREAPSRGLFQLELAVGKGALVGGLVGLALGWAIGYVWEQIHRRRRRSRPAA